MEFFGNVQSIVQQIHAAGKLELLYTLVGRFIKENIELIIIFIRSIIIALVYLHPTVKELHLLKVLS